MGERSPKSSKLGKLYPRATRAKCSAGRANARLVGRETTRVIRLSGGAGAKAGFSSQIGGIAHVTR